MRKGEQERLLGDDGGPGVRDVVQIDGERI
jgi:hypothetical protein